MFVKFLKFLKRKLAGKTARTTEEIKKRTSAVNEEKSPEDITFASSDKTSSSVGMPKKTSQEALFSLLKK